MANTVIKLLDNSTLRHQYGQRAREKVLAGYNGEAIGKAIEEHYWEVINANKNKTSKDA
jgi:glycosyltransferase involved in cell wall biosynthesis